MPITDAEWSQAAEWFESNGYIIHDSDDGGFTFTEDINGQNWFSAEDGYRLYLELSCQI
jgi:hypothetical protein